MDLERWAAYSYLDLANAQERRYRGGMRTRTEGRYTTEYKDPGKHLLTKLYVVEGRTLSDIAGLFGCGYHVVAKWLRSHDIAIRRAGIRIGTHLRSHPGTDALRDLYERRRLSVRSCAKILGIKPTTVRTWLSQAGVEMRSISEAKAGQNRSRDGPLPPRLAARADGGRWARRLVL